MNRNNQPCEWLPSYLIQELTPEHNIIFEAHLALCDTCKEELEELKHIWEGLPYTMELVTPPSELKDEVLSAIFGETSADKPARNSWSYNETRTHSKLYRYGLIPAAALILIAGGLWTWSWIKPEGTLTMSSELVEPARLQQEFKLQAFDPSNPNGEGRVWMTQQGNNRQVVLHVSGLSETQGDEAYQMWMIKDSKRYSCGTFKVGQEGSGVLVYPLNYEVQFDSIGITLEPDANGTKPRGKKVLGN
jgi:hypothetical protein